MGHLCRSVEENGLSNESLVEDAKLRKKNGIIGVCVCVHTKAYEGINLNL
jgi:hypothetical protein